MATVGPPYRFTLLDGPHDAHKALEALILRVEEVFGIAVEEDLPLLEKHEAIGNAARELKRMRHDHECAMLRRK